ncbi:MAG: hypothetical protein WA160_03685 [Pseudobdellovibrio sp.]
MNPRKKVSKKWTAIPSEFLAQIKTVFEENFKGHLSDKSIKVMGRIYPTEILLRIGINQKGELRYNNFEVSLDHSHSKQDTVSQIHIAVDALASLILDFFENEENHELPYVWQEQPFENQKIWLQYTSENPDLEAEANKLLGLEEGTLLNEDESELDSLDEEVSTENSAEESEELYDTTDLDMKNPQIFKSNKKKKKDDLH